MNNNLSDGGLDKVFAALADPTRRDILKQLSQGQATVSELAKPYDMSQPAISKHLKVLENAGLIDRLVEKQSRPAKLNAKNLAAATAWLEEFKQFWTGSFGQLDTVLETLKMADRKTGHDE